MFWGFFSNKENKGIQQVGIKELFITYHCYFFILIGQTICLIFWYQQKEKKHNIGYVDFIHIFTFYFCHNEGI